VANGFNYLCEENLLKLNLFNVINFKYDSTVLHNASEELCATFTIEVAATGAATLYLYIRSITTWIFICFSGIICNACQTFSLKFQTIVKRYNFLYGKG
jgi:hypothetical protein